MLRLRPLPESAVSSLIHTAVLSGARRSVFAIPPVWTFARQQAIRPGAFSLADLSPASYALTVVASGFETDEIEVVVGDTETLLVRIELNVSSLNSTVTVTAGRGTVADVAESPQVATVRDRTYMLERRLTTLGNALEASPGILVQQTTYGQASPILRGLTGYHVLNLIDGIRLNNSIFRSGPNQYLSFIEPGQVRRIEAVLEPAGSQYGSDLTGWNDQHSDRFGAIWSRIETREARRALFVGRKRRSVGRRQCRVFALRPQVCLAHRELGTPHQRPALRWGRRFQKRLPAILRPRIRSDQRPDGRLPSGYGFLAVRIPFQAVGRTIHEPAS